jgi:hypothetical protein
MVKECRSMLVRQDLKAKTMEEAAGSSQTIRKSGSGCSAGEPG